MAKDKVIFLRVAADIHAAVVKQAAADGKSINVWCGDAIFAALPDFDVPSEEPEVKESDRE